MKEPQLLNNFLRSGLIVLAMSNLASLINYGFLILATRKLGPSNYSIVASVTALGTTFFGIFSIIPQIVAKALIYTGKNRKERKLVLNKIRLIIALFLLILVSIYITFSKQILYFLRFDNCYLMLIYLLSVVSSVTMLYNTGRLQAIQNFVSISVKDFTFSLLKIVFGLVLIYILLLSVYGALLADAIASIIVAIGMYIYANINEKLYLDKNIPIDGVESVNFTLLRNNLIRFIIPAITVAWVSGILLSMDIYFSKHFLSPSEAGVYSAAASIGRISLYFSGSLGAILFPKVLKNKETGISSTKDLFTIIVVTGFASILISIALSFFGEEIVKVLYGEKYIGSGRIVTIISWAMTFF